MIHLKYQVWLVIHKCKHKKENVNTVKPVLSSHTKRDKTKVLKTSGSLMKVESIAECSTGVFCNTFNRHEAIICLENIFLGLFLSDRLRQVLL